MVLKQNGLQWLSLPGDESPETMFGKTKPDYGFSIEHIVPVIRTSC
jgi:hypothetical protein